MIYTAVSISDYPAGSGFTTGKVIGLQPPSTCYDAAAVLYLSTPEIGGFCSDIGSDGLVVGMQLEIRIALSQSP
jgi:hypothetical protein